MLVGVVIPVGPGHEEISNRCVKSLEHAFDRDPGPFDAQLIQRIADTDHKGPSWARNEAIKVLHEVVDWIFIMDADDMAHPACFEHMMDLDKDIGAVWGPMAWAKGGEISYSYVPHSFEDMLRGAGKGTIVSHPIFVKPHLAYEIGYCEDMYLLEDVEFFISVCAETEYKKTELPLGIRKRHGTPKVPKLENKKTYRPQIGAIRKFWEKRGRVALTPELKKIRRKAGGKEFYRG